eukprot:1620398-Pyramimonas_sp.AAC.3
MGKYVPHSQGVEDSGYDTFSPGGHMGLGFKPASGESSEDEDDEPDQCSLLDDLEAKLAGFLEATQFLTEGLLDEEEVLAIKVRVLRVRNTPSHTRYARLQRRPT